MPTEYKQELPLRVGLVGLSSESISQDDKGYCWFPVGYYDIKTGQRIWVRVEVTALEPIREFRDVIVANVQGDVKEHTPVELSYEKLAGGYQRATELYKLPVTEAHVYDDYKEISFTATETNYTIGTAANEADATIPTFEAKSLLLLADQDCLIRFNESDRVQHKLTANVYYSFNRRCEKLYVVRDTADGTLRVWAEG